MRALDGPAAGITLGLARAPQFLRLVCTGTSWDALDQPWDAPKPDEIVHVYRRAETDGRLLCSRCGDVFNAHLLRAFDAMLRERGERGILP